MALLNINLLQQQQTRLSRMNQANFVATVVAGTIVALQLLVVVFLFSTIAIRSAEKDGLQKTAEEFQLKTNEINRYDGRKEFYPDMNLTSKAKAFQQQIESATSLVDNHKYFSLYVSEIAINTPRTIRFTSFTSDINNRLTIVGQATAYGEVSKLVESFGKLSFAKGTNLQEAKLDPAAQALCAAGGDQCRPITFTMNIDLKTAAELNKLPSPTNQSGSATPRPAATGSPAPRPTGSPGGPR